MLKRYPLSLGIIIFVLLASFSCSSSEKAKEENNTSQDSLKHLMSLPPGTSDIKAEIIKCSEEKSELICRIKIQEVFSYGSSVSPLPPGTEIEVYIASNQLEQESKKIKENDIIFARISQTLAPENEQYWTIIMFNK
jgi:hypothetical protein